MPDDRNNKPKQVSKNRVRYTFIFIIILTLFSALIVTPNLPSQIPGAGWFKSKAPKLGLDLQGGAHLLYQADVSDIPAENRNDQVESLRDVIERRINVYGISEPLVQTNHIGDNYRIIVELAGVFDIDEAIAIIDKTPLLEFKVSGPADASDSTEQQDLAKELAQSILDRVLAGEDFGDLAFEFSQDPGSADNRGELPWVKRGVFVPEFDQAIFDDLKVGEVTPELVQSQFGYHIIKKLDDRQTDTGEEEVLASHILIKFQDDVLANINWVDSGLDGRSISGARVNFDPNTNEPYVIVDFNSEGKDLFSRLTTENVGLPIGIFLDGDLRSSPIVQEPITDGTAQISGNFSVTEAKQLVKDLNLGALPTPIELVSQQTVGATLGADSVQKSLIAGIAGLIAAALFMLIFYRIPGIIAVVALLVYSVITLAVFQLFSVTMTLAGVAGFILSVGMAVDANILIFERTKEELREGKSLKTAVENGFSRAWTSIRDSNISSLITVLILAWFGTSIIKGFAITLGLGIIISMFSAITVSRTFLRMMFKNKDISKPELFGIRKLKTKKD